MKKIHTKREANEILEILSNYYKDAKCGLDYKDEYYLLVALILAAQCTDERVNKITPIFFSKYPTLQDVANANLEDISEIIKPCGFYNNKAKNILSSAKQIVKNYNQKVPDTMEELLLLDGIGRKSANIILQECFYKTVGIAVDTHVSRTSHRIGFTSSTEPLKQELELMKKIDKKYWNKINHILVNHGRKFCNAKKPLCEKCPILNKCKNPLAKIS